MQKRLFRTSLSVVLTMCSTVLFLCTISAVAQETTPFSMQIQNLTPKQQINYVLEARKRGYSLLQLEGLAKAQGATLEDLSLLRTAWSVSQTGEVAEGSENTILAQKVTYEMKKRDHLAMNHRFLISLRKRKNQTFLEAVFLQIKTSQKPHSFTWPRLQDIV